MFIVLLEFTGDKTRAGALLESHKAWIKRGFDAGVFLLVGGLEPDRGGAILAHRIVRSDLEQRVNEDPFVIEQVVTAEIIEVTPARADERLRFLLG